jgi:hypothetical protein
MADTITVRDYERAERQLRIEEERRAFAIHAAIYVTANVAITAYNLFVESEFVWFYMPSLAWGVILALHYIFSVRLIDRQIRKRQTKVELMARSSG